MTRWWRWWWWFVWFVNREQGKKIEVKHHWITTKSFKSETNRPLLLLVCVCVRTLEIIPSQFFEFNVCITNSTHCRLAGWLADWLDNECIDTFLDKHLTSTNIFKWFTFISFIPTFFSHSSASVPPSLLHSHHSIEMPSFLFLYLSLFILSFSISFEFKVLPLLVL